jgi:hypothetical protein
MLEIKDALPVILDILENEALYTPQSSSNVLDELFNQRKKFILLRKTC